MSKFSQKYILQQQTPMIHFQDKEPGATLRASEVKPKLDTFLIAKIGGIKNIQSNWWIAYDKEKNELIHPALNYKLRFEASNDESNSHPVYTKKTDKKGRTKLEGVGAYFFTETDESKIKKSSYYQKIEMFIFSTEPTLLSMMDADTLCEFFATHNFGFRQDKGFGSFIFLGNESDRKTPADSCSFAKNISNHYLEIVSNDTTRILGNIKTFWQEIKGGLNNPHIKPPLYKRSFLMKEYFGHLSPYPHLNDKKAMKQALLNTGMFILDVNHIEDYDNERNPAPASIKLKPSAGISNAEYIRGLLGFAGFYSFRNVQLRYPPTGINQEKHFDVTFLVDGGKIQRFPAPILFKPIIEGNKTYVFLITNQEAFQQLSSQTVTLKPQVFEDKDNALQSAVNHAISKIPDITCTIPYSEDFLNDFFNKAESSGEWRYLKHV